MQAHWTKYGPPVYMAVAGYLGWGEANKTDKKPTGGPVDPLANTSEVGDLEHLFQSLAGMGGVL